MKGIIMDISAFKLILSKQIKSKRIEKGYTQEQLSEKIGVSNASISDYENAKNNKLPNINHLSDIAEALEVSIDWLLGFPSAPDGITLMLEFIKVFKPEFEIETDEKNNEYVVMKLKGMNGSYSQVEIAKFVKTYEKINEMKELSSVSEKMKDDLDRSLYEEYKHIPGLPNYIRNKAE